jgi:hypothetical protein
MCSVREIAGYTGKRVAPSGKARGSSLRGELRGRVGHPQRSCAGDSTGPLVGLI